ncbi:MAG TPA: ABC transporter ATP-binding protein [Hyphomicrobiales bacterium]|nr:ABC transporter ATP-binding protein [Hyphomicrobiales bacterium]
MLDHAPAIRVRDLVKRYHGATAVGGISFEVPRGAIVGLLGGNGAGKTTTIASVMGLVTPSAGHVEVLGAAMPRERHRVLHRMNFESPYVDLPGRLTVRQNLEVFARLYGVRRPSERIGELADGLDLGGFLDRQTGTLSSGQKTRVALAKALVNAPEVLLLDEPTASLDPDTADWIRGRIMAERDERGVSILLASHNMIEVERLCDRVLMMRRGTIVDAGSPAELIGRYDRQTMEEVFLDIARGRRAAAEEVA